jgi:hypothetical protein
VEEWNGEKRLRRENKEREEEKNATGLSRKRESEREDRRGDKQGF